MQIINGFVKLGFQSTNQSCQALIFRIECGFQAFNASCKFAVFRCKVGSYQVFGFFQTVTYCTNAAFKFSLVVGNFFSEFVDFFAKLGFQSTNQSCQTLVFCFKSGFQTCNTICKLTVRFLKFELQRGFCLLNQILYRSNLVVNVGLVVVYAFLQIVNGFVKIFLYFLYLVFKVVLRRIQHRGQVVHRGLQLGVRGVGVVQCGNSVLRRLQLRRQVCQPCFKVFVIVVKCVQRGFKCRCLLVKLVYLCLQRVALDVHCIQAHFVAVGLGQAADNLLSVGKHNRLRTGHGRPTHKGVPRRHNNAKFVSRKT